MKYISPNWLICYGSSWQYEVCQMYGTVAFKKKKKVFDNNAEVIWGKSHLQM